MRQAEIASAQAGGPFGSTVGYSPIMGEEILPAGSGQYGYLAGPTGGHYCGDGISVYTAQFAGIPHGARLQFFRAWVYDDVDENIQFAVYRRCQPNFQEGQRVITLLGLVTTSGTGGLVISRRFEALDDADHAASAARRQFPARLCGEPSRAAQVALATRTNMRLAGAVVSASLVLERSTP